MQSCLKRKTTTILITIWWDNKFTRVHLTDSLLLKIKAIVGEPTIMSFAKVLSLRITRILPQLTRFIPFIETGPNKHSKSTVTTEDN